MDKTIKYVGTDTQGRKVYQGESGRLYCNTTIMPNRPPHYCTKLNNDFDGEPDLDMPQNWNPTAIDGNNTGKNTISINESQLRRIVKESIRKVLTENISNRGKDTLIQAICQKYPQRNEGGWAKEFNEWIPIEAYISHIDGATATANLRIGDIEENGGTTIEEEVPLQSLPISALQSILNAE